MSDGTLERQVAGTPAREIHVEVLDGPNAGLQAESSFDAITVGTAEGNDVRLSDRSTSRFHLEIGREHVRIFVRDLGSTNGTVIGDVVLQGGRAYVPSGCVVRVGDTRLRIREGNTRLVAGATSRQELGELSGRSPQMRRVMDRVEQLASSDVSVLIVGESGTGKEVTARTLHGLSPRSRDPFVTMDCGAVAPNLFESTLFGHERGAFTGAERRHLGCFERAGKGTLFLDEIGELLPEQQVALLGVLERRSFTRVGGQNALPFQGRVLAATNRDLREEVNRGTFRLDLFYRLAVVTVDIPPLRERQEDIPLLIQRFIHEEGSTRDMDSLFGDALPTLLRHPWPGNGRELRNVVAGTLAIGEVPTLFSGEPDPPERAPGALPLHLPYREAKRQVAENFEEAYIRHLLEQTEGNVAKAARIAQMNRSYLIDLLKKHGVR